ncbi:MAG: uracil-DNA glycosylase [Pseudomonadota bacterium]
MSDAGRTAYLQAMDIPIWISKSGQQQDVSAQKDIPVTNLNWEQLEHQVSHCQQCGLSQSRKQTVFGTGNQQAELMIIGEAPGAEEDRQGLPFVGRAGQLLTNMLSAIRLDRKQIYIANILKCRPPGNRDPQPAEVIACKEYLNRQIALIQPRLILSVGGVSAKNLLDTDQPVSRLRGKFHQYAPTQTKLMVTYHPAYLLRRPEEKEKTWKDLQQVRICLSDTSH